MTYFGFLLRFLFLPIAIMLLVTWIDVRRGRSIPRRLHAWPVWAAITVHCLLALTYTTFWDNYLVATGVWGYDPALVTGIVFGWVPIEEYTFFLVQPILGGLWIVFLMRRLNADVDSISLARRWRLVPLLLLAAVWLASVATLASGWQQGTYLGLELVWALPPIMLQLAFGGDILRRYGRLVLLSILSLTAYLSLADALAIGSGTWEINPAKSVHLLIGGVLPLEELVFFLLTNTLITFGIVLLMARESHDRFGAIAQRLGRGQNGDGSSHESAGD